VEETPSAVPYSKVKKCTLCETEVKNMENGIVCATNSTK